MRHRRGGENRDSIEGGSNRRIEPVTIDRGRRSDTGPERTPLKGDHCGRSPRACDETRRAREKAHAPIGRTRGGNREGPARGHANPESAGSIA
jgi:hypothetical protein